MKSKIRRVLLCASACCPNWGSEPGLGWAAYRALRQKYDVRVICSASGQSAIREACQAGEAEFKDFRFIRETSRFSGYPAIDKWICWVNFLRFQEMLNRLGRDQIKEFQPDIIHQVTIATWRSGNPLAGLGTPFVWGPLGGAEKLPFSFLREFSFYSRAFEIFRAFFGAVSRHQPLVKQTARLADYIFASNRATFELVASIRGNRTQMEILPVVFFSPEKMRRFNEPSLRSSAPGSPLQVFSGGYVEARKGIGLALQALARLKAQGFLFQYENSGIGPEKDRLERLIRKLGLVDCARFVSSYPGSAYDQKLRSTDVFLFPSLRDNCPATLLEAMGHGCVPVVADHAGPGEIVTPECGIKIPVTHPADFVDRLTNELARLFQDAEKRRRLGEAARQRVLEKFSEANWLARVENAYRKVLAAP